METIMKRSFFALITGALVMAATVPVAHAWGSLGHSVIDRTAIDSIPADGPVFIKAHFDDILDLAGLPDVWRGDSYPDESAGQQENVSHVWMAEQYAFLKEIPRSRTALAQALALEYAHKPYPSPATFLHEAGGSPYASAEAYARLTAMFRALRRSRADGKAAPVLERSIAMQAAVLGHYVGDGANPIHDSIHVFGWVGPNPNGYRTDHAFHGAFEGQYVEAIGLTEADVIGRVGAPGHLQGDVFKLLVDYVTERNSKVEEIYKAEKRMHLEDAHDKEARELVYSAIASGAVMFRDLLYRAWIESALPCENRLDASANYIGCLAPLEVPARNNE